MLLFAKQKGLRNYSIDFWYETRRKDNYKFYWFVTETDKKESYSVLYRINPETGAVKVKKLLPLKKMAVDSDTTNIDAS